MRNHLAESAGPLWGELATLAERWVAHITFPVDLQEMAAERKGFRRNVPHHTSDVFAHSARLPDEGDLARAVEVLNGGQKVASWPAAAR